MEALQRGTAQVKQLVLPAACALRPAVLWLQIIHSPDVTNSWIRTVCGLYVHVVTRSVIFLHESLLKPDFLRFDLAPKNSTFIREQKLCMRKCLVTGVAPPEPFWYYWKAEQGGRQGGEENDPICSRLSR